MTKEQILVVDDEEDILELVSFSLRRERFEVRCAKSGEEALDKILKDPPDLILLDLMLPGMDGLEVARRLKGDPRTEKIPVIMLTAKGEEADIVVGLELGADDYITKPFSPRILIARVKAALRRRRAGSTREDSVITIRDMVIHPGRHEVLVQGNPAPLTSTEFHILNHLARRPGWVYTRSQIVDAVKGEDYPVTDRSVDVHIVGLRKKLGPAGAYIETVRGVGYRLKE